MMTAPFKNVAAVWVFSTIVALLPAASPAQAQEPAARDIVADAWIYAYPMLFNYKSMYEQTQDAKSANYIGAFNKFRHYNRLFTPADTTVVTPNNDTPYSWAWLDLRSGPIMLSTPDVEDRYYVIQCVDLFTYNFAYVGSRATGSKAGRYLFISPVWQGKAPEGIDKTFRCESNFCLLLMRVQLKSADDMKHVEAVQDGMKLTPEPDPKGWIGIAFPPIEWPVWDVKKISTPEFVNYLNLLLSFTKPDPSEKELLARFATIGIAPGKPFDVAKLDPAMLKAYQEGIELGQKRLAEREKVTTSSLGLFGTRAELKNDYLTRAVAAAMGLYGNSAVEAVYGGGSIDAQGKPLDGSKHKYTLRFAAGNMPPAKFFWSATLYSLPGRALVENPIQRYSVGSVTPGMKTAADDSLTIYIQADPPKGDAQANWLPAARGPFDVVLRMYGPSQAVQSGEWKMPAIERVD